MHTLLRWVGGKWRGIDAFVSFLPVDFKNRFYVEPFFGSGAMLFKMQPYRALISDINVDLVNMYLDIRDHPDEIINLLHFHDVKDCEEHYYEARDLFNDEKVKKYDENASTVDQSARFIYLNARCFNGLYRENAKGKMNSPFAKDLKGMKKVCDDANIRAISFYLKSRDVHIISGSYERVVDYIDEHLKLDSNVFFFLDPPYYPISDTASFTSYNKNFWKHDDFLKLRTFVDGLNGKKWRFLLCNHSVPEIKEMFAGYYQAEHVVSRSVSCKARERNPVVEIVVSNYKVNRRTPEMDVL